MRSPRPALTGVAALAALATLATACGGSSGTSTAAAGASSASGAAAASSAPTKLDTFTFRTEYSPEGSYAPYLYAQQLNYFKDEGIDFKLEYGKGSVTTAQGVAAGDVNAGQVAPGVAVLANDKGADLVTIGQFTARQDTGFLVSQSSPLNTVKDLTGKKVILTAGTNSSILLPAVLNLAGMKPDALTLQNLAYSLTDSSYASGQGDALITSIPFALPLANRKRPSKAIPWSSVGFALLGYGIIARNSDVAKNPDLYTRFLRATYKGIAAAMVDPEKASAAYAASQSTLDPKSVAEQWKLWTEYVCSDNMASSHEPLGYNDEKDWTATVGILKQYLGLKSTEPASTYFTNKFFKGNGPVSAKSC